MGGRLTDELLTELGAFLDDPGLCALACSERARWDKSSLQRQARKDGQLLFLRLRGHADCRRDCERAADLLQHIWVFVSDCFWGSPRCCHSDVYFNIEFVCRRCDIPHLHKAVKAYLARLRRLPLRTLSETLHFHDEYSGFWTFDGGVRRHVDLLCRLTRKLVRQAAVSDTYPHNFGTWSCVRV